MSTKLNFITHIRGLDCVILGGPYLAECSCRGEKLLGIKGRILAQNWALKPEAANALIRVLLTRPMIFHLLKLPSDGQTHTALGEITGKSHGCCMLRSTSAVRMQEPRTVHSISRNHRNNKNRHTQTTSPTQCCI